MSTNGKAPASAEARGLTALSQGTPVGASGGESLAEAVKPVGAYMTEDHQYFWQGRGPLVSVTTALKVIEREAINRHRQKESLLALIAGLDNGYLEAMEVTEEEAVAWAMWQPQGAFEDAGAFGTSVHLMAHSEGSQPGSTGFPMPDKVIPYLEAFRGFLAFLEGSGGSILSSEHAVFNLSDGYAGTYDLILEYQDQVWLVDLKTSGGYYPEFGLQLAAYGRAQFVGLEGDPVQYPLPHIDRYAVLHLRPDKYPDDAPALRWRLVEYPITGRDYVAFLAALDLWQWKKEGRFRQSILNKAITKGEKSKVEADPLTQEDSLGS